MYPLVLLALGIVCCILVSSLSTHFVNVVTIDRIEITLKCQLVISTLLLAGVLYVSAAISFPSHFKMLTSE